jgi:5-methylcytosine-specific restriction endonuclease McrA
MSQSLRFWALARRDGAKCKDCGRTDHLTIHHPIPIAKGGKDIPSNRIFLCPTCHINRHGVIAYLPPIKNLEEKMNK